MHFFPHYLVVVIRINRCHQNEVAVIFEVKKINRDILLWLRNFALKTKTKQKSVNENLSKHEYCIILTLLCEV